MSGFSLERFVGPAATAGEGCCQPELSHTSNAGPNPLVLLADRVSSLQDQRDPIKYSAQVAPPKQLFSVGLLQLQKQALSAPTIRTGCPQRAVKVPDISVPHIGPYGGANAIGVAPLRPVHAINQSLSAPSGPPPPAPATLKPSPASTGGFSLGLGADVAAPFPTQSAPGGATAVGATMMPAVLGPLHSVHPPHFGPSPVAMTRPWAGYYLNSRSATTTPAGGGLQLAQQSRYMATPPQAPQASPEHATAITALVGDRVSHDASSFAPGDSNSSFLRAIAPNPATVKSLPVELPEGVRADNESDLVSGWRTDRASVATDNSAEVPVTQLDRHKASTLAATLRSVNSATLDRSEFLKFIDKFAAGDLCVKNNKIFDRYGVAVEDWRQLTDSGATRTLDAAAWQLESVWRDASKDGLLSPEFVAIFRDAFSELKSELLSGSNLEPSGKFSDESQVDEFSEFFSSSITSRESSTLHTATPTGTYSFQQKNPYMNPPPTATEASAAAPTPEKDRIAQARELLVQEQIAEAILVLEAAVQENPANAPCWQLLGEVLASNDEDVEAIYCFRRCLEHRPSDLEVFLRLGICLANELEVIQSLESFYKLIQNHPRFQTLVSSPPVRPETSTDYMGDLKREVVSVFEQAANLEPTNQQVHSALGVIFNVAQNVDQAVYYMVKALRLCEYNKSSKLWNQLGATLGNAGVDNAARLAYRHAVSLERTFVRAWANVGIGMANVATSSKEKTDEALRIFVNTLVLNPKATNVWRCVRNEAVQLGRFDLLEPIDNRDAQSLRRMVPNCISSYKDLKPEALIGPPEDPGATLDRIWEMWRAANNGILITRTNP